MEMQKVERFSSSTLVLLLFIAFSLSSVSTMAEIASPPVSDKRKTYIVFVINSSSPPSMDQDIEHFAIKTLEKILGSEKAAMESLGYIYRYAALGFSATLTPYEASLVRKEPGVISVRESEVYRIDNNSPDGGGGFR